MAYLKRLAEQREARGEPPAPDICPPEYWAERKRNEELKEKPRDAASL
jgi:hypothetical protein